MSAEYVSRQMPNPIRWRLEALEQQDREFTPRSDNILGRLVELGWAREVSSRLARKHEHKTYEITPHGRMALERERRGVDPYLRMTG